MSAQLLEAVWNFGPGSLALWSGGTEAVADGDIVSYYERADGVLVFVRIAAGEVEYGGA